MMKYFILLLIFTSVVHFTKGQTNAFVVEEVVHIDTITSAEVLYERTKMWFAETFVNSESVIQIDNEEEGTIVGKASFRYKPKVFQSSETIRGWVRYTISVYCRKGRYKFVISDFIHDGKSTDFDLITIDEECPYKIGLAGQNWKNKVWNDIKTQISTNNQLLIQSLKRKMEEPLSTEEDDW